MVAMVVITPMGLVWEAFFIGKILTMPPRLGSSFFTPPGPLSQLQGHSFYRLRFGFTSIDSLMVEFARSEEMVSRSLAVQITEKFRKEPGYATAPAQRPRKLSGRACQVVACRLFSAKKSLSAFAKAMARQSWFATA